MWLKNLIGIWIYPKIRPNTEHSWDDLHINYIQKVTTSWAPCIVGNVYITPPARICFKSPPSLKCSSDEASTANPKLKISEIVVLNKQCAIPGIWPIPCMQTVLVFRPIFATSVNFAHCICGQQHLSDMLALGAPKVMSLTRAFIRTMKIRCHC